MVQILIAITAGAVTVGAPCILPLLPILLGSSVGQRSKTRPLFIALGFIITFSLTGLLLSYLVSRFQFSPELIRQIGIVALTIFGLLLVWPTIFERLSLYLSRSINRANQIGQRAGTGNFGGLVLGIMLGVIWTPCAGPVLGSILTLIATQTNLTEATILLLAYALGAGIPMVLIAYGGQYVTTKVRVIARYSSRIQQIFGVIILSLAIAMFFQYDLLLQAKLLEILPEWNFANSNIFY